MSVARLSCNAKISEVFHIIYKTCKVIKNISLLRCTANQSGTGHKLHFSPMIQLGPNWQQSTTKMAVARLRCDGEIFGSISYHWYYHIRSGKIHLCSVVTPINPAQTISSIFSPKIQLGPTSHQSTTKMAVARLRCDGDSFGIISYHW